MIWGCCHRVGWRHRERMCLTYYASLITDFPTGLIIVWYQQAQLTMTDFAHQEVWGERTQVTHTSPDSLLVWHLRHRILHLSIMRNRSIPYASLSHVSCNIQFSFLPVANCRFIFWLFYDYFVGLWSLISQQIRRGHAEYKKVTIWNEEPYQARLMPQQWHLLTWICWRVSAENLAAVHFLMYDYFNVWL